MKNERIKNASRNIFFGVLLKTYQILLPFLMRTAMIYLMGMQYLGLSSLFASVLQVLNLAELGVGTSMVYSMYKPIAENDSITICALLKLYKTYYRAIGTFIAVTGIGLMPFIRNLINGDVPCGINLYVLYLLNLSATVLSYWLFAYKNSLLQAHQRMDVVSKVTLVTNTIQYGIQILVLWAFHDYYLYVIGMLFAQVLNNLLIATIAARMYPGYQPEGQLDRRIVKDINQRIRDLFTAKFGSVVVGAADTIVISTFLGLTTLAVFQNYYFVLNAVYGIVLVLFSAVIAGIGNSLVTESMEKNFNDMKVLTFLTCWISTICVCCFAVLYQPFMKLWVGEELMLGYSHIILFCVYFFVMVLSMVWATVKDAAGLWHADKFRPLIGALTNLIMNVILVNFIGLYGILLSTIISYVFISMPWLVHNLFLLLYKRSMKEYLKRLAIYGFVCILSGTITVGVCYITRLNGFTNFIVYGLTALAVPNILQWMFYRKSEEFKKSRQFVLKVIRIGEK